MEGGGGLEVEWIPKVVSTIFYCIYKDVTVLKQNTTHPKINLIWVNKTLSNEKIYLSIQHLLSLTYLP